MRFDTIMLLGVLLGGLGFLVYLYLKIRRSVERFSHSLFGVKSLTEGLNRQADVLAATPKSVSSMTKLYLPQIGRDFPEFNWVEFKQKAETYLKAVLIAVSEHDLAYLEGASEELLKHMRLEIENLKSAGYHVCYHNIHIHQTEITKYIKRNGTCVIMLQSAIEYIYYKTNQSGELIEGSKDRKEQSRYNYELVYVQDVSQVLDSSSGLGVSCPNCGAPVTNLGSKYCEYCGGGVSELNIRVWSFDKIYKVTGK